MHIIYDRTDIHVFVQSVSFLFASYHENLGRCAAEVHIRDLDSGNVVTVGGHGPEGQHMLSSLTQLPVRLSSTTPPPQHRPRVWPIRIDNTWASRSHFLSIGR